MKTLLIIASCLTVYVSSHANIVWPYTWFDKGGKIGMSPSGQCAAGYEGAGVGACSWFTNYTFISGEPTLPEEMRSWTDIVIGGYHVDYTKTNPWRAPGSAPIYSPCGVAGGNPEGCPVGEGEIGDNCPGGGFAYGPDAVNVDFQVGYKQYIPKEFHPIEPPGCSDHRVEGRGCGRGGLGYRCQPWRRILI